MGLGILDMIGLAATLVFAIPAALLGVQKLLEGDQLLGGVLVAIAVLMVYLPQRLTTPQDLPGRALQFVVGGAVADPDETESGRTEK